MAKSSTATPSPASTDERVEAIREFNRYYTRRIGVLQESLLETAFSLTESRLLWEFAHRDRTTATELARDLGLDPGYLSRLLRAFKDKGLISSERGADDARHRHLKLTAAGRRAFAPLERRTRAQIDALLASLTDAEQQRLLQSMASIRRLLDPPAAAQRAPYLLRAQRPGDIGWVIERHGTLYAHEYRWDMSFEALVAHIAARFVESFDPAREACWIAERDQLNVGCVFLVQARDDATDAPLEGVAQLRLLLVEPAARGLGIGARLVDECERFARRAGYRRIVLWTNSVLLAARGIYAKAGYRLVRSERHRSFGHDLVGETWELELVEAATADAARPTAPIRRIPGARSRTSAGR
jgi:DNA-binding MarR family transcriptional regulator/GNAT superfamily N-acetyltransferase